MNSIPQLNSTFQTRWNHLKHVFSSTNSPWKTYPKRQKHCKKTYNHPTTIRPSSKDIQSRILSSPCHCCWAPVIPRSSKSWKPSWSPPRERPCHAEDLPGSTGWDWYLRTEPTPYKNNLTYIQIQKQKKKFVVVFGMTAKDLCVTSCGKKSTKNGPFFRESIIVLRLSRLDILRWSWTSTSWWK